MTPTEEGIKTDVPMRSVRLPVSLPSIIETAKTLPPKQNRESGRFTGTETGTEQETDSPSSVYDFDERELVRMRHARRAGQCTALSSH
jgi:hypothetical protein